MDNLVPPKLRALSEAQLQAALSELPTNQNGLEKAQLILERQAILRSVDKKEFENWAAQMKELGTPEALRAVNQALGLEAPPESISIETPSNPDLFTSPIGTVTRKSVRKSRRSRNSLLTTFVSWVGFIGIFGTASKVLGFSFLDSVLGLLVGLLFSGLVKMSLITHDNSPLFRSAAAFGAKTYKLWFFVAFASFTGFIGNLAVNFAGASLFSFSVVSSGIEFSNLIVLVIAAVVSILLGIFTRSTLATWLQLAAIATAIGFLVVITPMPTWAGLDFDVSLDLVTASILAFGLALVMTAMFRPHTKASYLDIAVGQILAALATPVALWFLYESSAVLFDFTVFLLAILLVLFLAFESIKETLGINATWFGVLAVMAGAALAFLAEVYFEPITLLGFSFSYIIALTLDSIFRSQPLHIPSIRNSYGFYGGFSTSSFLVLVLGTLASSQMVSLLLRPYGLVLDPLVLGFCTALIIALARFLVVKNQDKEVSNVESRGNSLDNLLGL